MVKGSSKTLSQLQVKYDNLRGHFEKMGSALIAFSGGVDSTVLLKVAKEVLGEEAAAVTARSCFVPEREMQEAELFCQSEGIKHFIVDVNPLATDGIKYNPANRCYLCKREIFSRFKELAAKQDYEYICEGSNASDMGDFRPGRKAIEELAITSPLLEAGFAKDELRVLGLSLGIPNWSKPSYSCLATRFVTGTAITPEALKMIERAEELLFDAEFEQVRVRVHEVGSYDGEGQETSSVRNYLARVEVEADELEDLYEFAANSDFISQMHEIGFAFVTCDLEGYRAGSTNLV